SVTCLFFEFEIEPSHAELHKSCNFNAIALRNNCIKTLNHCIDRRFNCEYTAKKFISTAITLHFCENIIQIEPGRKPMTKSSLGSR
ncbi:hypothetical protein, partial [Pseudomonas cannabina]|uniref:hypothetical protein n=1 Tax=Pseudomonas cannabina TaxID=86840 RepID=UPI001C7FA687